VFQSHLDHNKKTAVDDNDPWLFTEPATALDVFPGDLGNAINLAFSQSPSPTLVYGIRTPTANNLPDVDNALAKASGLDAQFVVIAGTPLRAAGDADHPATSTLFGKLASHVTSVSADGDGKERMGVVMLAKGATDPGIVSGSLAADRMIYVAHKSIEDAAAAVAGTIAGYEPHISVLLKEVKLALDPADPHFLPSDIATINGAETFGAGPAGKGVNWLVHPSLIPGSAVYLGEAYTGNPGGTKKFIDIVRTLDDISFKLKARLIATIGNLRISRSGLRSLAAQIEAELTPLVRNEVIEGFVIGIPLLTMLDKDPNSRTQVENDQIKNAQDSRLVPVLVQVDYAGAIHRLDITLKFV
jgi:hypothetical protein